MSQPAPPGDWSKPIDWTTVFVTVGAVLCVVWVLLCLKALYFKEKAKPTRTFSNSMPTKVSSSVNASVNGGNIKNVSAGLHQRTSNHNQTGEYNAFGN